jgi:flagellar M-ring protein FliF
MDQLTKLIAGLSGKQKLSIALALVLVAGGIVALTRWKHETDFRTLYSSMAPEDAAMVVQKLKETGVEYRLLDNGNGVMVPSSKVAEARLTLAAVGLPKSGRIGFELFDKTNFGATELVEHINYQRALEGELERSVMAISEVEMARVHVTLTKESVFLDQQQPAKASVMVKLRVGMQISPQNVVAISHLVASAVQGLAPTAVSILDTDGHLLTRPVRPSTDGPQITSETVELRQQLERDLVTKINATLEPLLGADRFRAGASVDCDLTSTEQQEETFDPTKSVMVTSQKTDDVTDRATTAGIPGTASNLPRPTTESVTAVGGGSVSRRTENVNYESSRVIRKTRIPQGMIKRLSISVLVGQGLHWEGAGKAKHHVFDPPAPETLKTIKDLVSAVTGLNTERGDQIIVDSLPFEAMLKDAPAQPEAAPVSNPSTKGPYWQDMITRHWSWILMAVLGLGVIGVLTKSLRKRPRTLENVVETSRTIASPDKVLELETTQSPYVHSLEGLPDKLKENLIERVRLVTQEDLPMTTAILRTWMQEPQSSTITK